MRHALSLDSLLSATRSHRAHSLKATSPVKFCLRWVKRLSIGLIMLASTAQAQLNQTIFYQHPSVDKQALERFVDKMVKQHNFQRAEIESVFSRIGYRQDVIGKLSRPAEKTKTWPEYQSIFLQEDRIQAGVDFIKTYASAMQRAEAQYGVPINVIAAIIGVETKYGQIKGNTSVIEALATISFGYPRRAKYFTSELEHYFRLMRDENRDLFANQGSYAGAMGYPQFMPSSYMNHAVDYDGDGKKDLFENPIDAIGSVANYLSHFGWQRGQPVYVSLSQAETQRVIAEGLQNRTADAISFIRQDIAVYGLQRVPPDQEVSVIRYDLGANGESYRLALKNFRVIKRYNTSDYYVTVVTELANAIAAKFR